MTKPLHLFIAPPYDTWDLVRGWGPFGDGWGMQHHLQVSTEGTGDIFAACHGQLSIRFDPSAPRSPEDPLQVLDDEAGVDTITVYLYPTPLSELLGPTFPDPTLAYDGIVLFAYERIDVTSLREALEPALLGVTAPVGALTADQAFESFLAGELNVPVDGGYPIGQFAARPDDASVREGRFGVLWGVGSVGPSHTYDIARDVVPSAWHIQAGVSGELPGMPYNLGPGGGRGYDHFDGVMFLVIDGQIRTRFRWSSYSSRHYTSAIRSSLRGNKLYRLRSARSTNTFRNYSFAVVDLGVTWAQDGVREARFYTDDPVTEDTAIAGTPPSGTGDGKTAIRLHHSVDGTPGNPGSHCSSAGCLVSPLYSELRTEMIRGYLNELASAGVSDPSLVSDLTSLVGVNQSQSETLYSSGLQWGGKIAGFLWVIRSDERPLG